MLQGLMRVSGAALPLTRMFYGRPSECLWEMDSGEVHRIPQGEGGEQGDRMVPLLYCLGATRRFGGCQHQLHPR